MNYSQSSWAQFFIKFLLIVKEQLLIAMLTVKEFTISLWNSLMKLSENKILERVRFNWLVNLPRENPSFGSRLF